MNRKNKEKRAGFSLVEVVVSTAILFFIAAAFLTMTAANGKILWQKMAKGSQWVKTLKLFFRERKEKFQRYLQDIK